MTGWEDVGPWAGRPRAQMMKSDEVEAMLHLRALGWGLRRIAKEFGCSKNTVRRYVAADGWMAYSRRAGGGKLEDQEAWLKERFFRHRGNAEVVRQDLVREQGVHVSLRTVERAVAPFRRLLTAEAKATVRFETPPGRHYVDSRVMLSNRDEADQGAWLASSWAPCTPHNPYRESSQARRPFESRRGLGPTWTGVPTRSKASRFIARSLRT